MTTLKATLFAGPFKDALKGLEALNEQAVFEFDSTGITVKCLDNDCTTVLRVSLTEDLFSEYEYNSSTSPTKLGVVLARIKDITKTLTVKDLLTLEYDSEQPQFLTISANGIRRTVRLVKLDLIKQVKTLPTPSDGWKFSGTLPLKGMKDFLRTVPDTIMDFSVVATKDTLYLRAMHGEEPIEWSPNVENWIQETDAVIQYSLAKVKAATHAGKKADASVMGGPDLPLWVEWDQAEGLSFTAVVAPKIGRSN
jgi:hypothetical protein